MSSGYVVAKSSMSLGYFRVDVDNRADNAFSSSTLFHIELHIAATTSTNVCFYQILGGSYCLLKNTGLQYLFLGRLKGCRRRWWLFLGTLGS